MNYKVTYYDAPDEVIDADRCDTIDKWVVFVPEADAEKVAAAMHEAGAGVIGDYDHAMFTSTGIGSFRPLDGATPAIGQVGEVERVPEARIEMVADSGLREDVRAALLESHPYEEVAFDVYPLVDVT